SEVALLELLERSGLKDWQRDYLERILLMKGNVKIVANTIKELNSSIGKKIDSRLLQKFWGLEYLVRVVGFDEEIIEDTVLPFVELADWDKVSFLGSAVLRVAGSPKSFKALMNVIEN